MAFYHLGALEHLIAGVGGMGVKVGLDGGLAALWLASERRLVEPQAGGLEQRGVGRDFLAGVDHYHIAHNHLAAGNLPDFSVPDDLHRLVVVDLVEDGKLFLGLLLKDKCDACGKGNGNEDAHWLIEDNGILVQAVVFIE